MPTDEPAQPRRRSRRALGRGPGAGGVGTPAVPQPAREPEAEPEPEAEREPEPVVEREPEPAPEAERRQVEAAPAEPAPPAESPPPAEPAPPAESPPPAEPAPAAEPEPTDVSAASAPVAPAPPAPTDVVPPEPPAAPSALPTPADDPATARKAPRRATPSEDASPDGMPADGEPAEGDGRFTVRLANFEGPFDLLLQLISKHKLDVTEVALSKVTDEFMAHIHAMGPDWDLDQTTEFLVVAATLLDLKAARLLPAAEVEDEADLALLEARDLLFARLLQYRAYKRIAEIFSERLAAEALSRPRTVGLEPHHAELLPEVVISIGPEGFAKLAVKAMRPKPKPQVYVEHIHAPLVSVREQAQVVIERLRAVGEASFRELTEDAVDTLTVVARFLALLELYRERAVALDQEEALGSLTVRWTGAADGQQPVVTDEFDQDPGDRAEERKQA